jgi:Glycoside-hydrolase family GH114
MVRDTQTAADEAPMTPPKRTYHAGRRAVLGLGLLLAMSAATAAILYSSADAEADFAMDPAAVRRQAMLKDVTSWAVNAHIEDAAALARNPAAMLVVSASDLAGRSASAVRKIAEDLQRTTEGSRRPVLASLPLAPGWDDPALSTVTRQLDELVAAGIDGVFFDCSQSLADARRDGRSAEERLVTFIVALSMRARQLNPDFLLIIDNAVELAADVRIASIIDGAARENLLFGIDGQGVANSRTDVISALHDLNRVKRSGRPVFVTEYLADDAISARTGARQNLRAMGFLSRFVVPRRAT